MSDATDLPAIIPVPGTVRETKPRQPYLLFLGDAEDAVEAKSAFGVRDWQPDAVIGQWGLPKCRVDLGLPSLDPAAARARGAESLLIGVAPVGGEINADWIPALVEALDAGLDIISGMHSRLTSIAALRAAADRNGRLLHDLRHSTQKFPVGTGRKRRGKRLLTVGTDCALGKKYTALALHRAFRREGIAATFRATGQTGIMISGEGVAIDAVVSDFVAGAAEWLSPENAPGHWDLIEGQGSLFHPGYAAVSLGLLHGSQPDAIVLCHDPGRLEIERYPGFVIPPLNEVIDLHLMMGRRTNPAIRCAAIALNTSALRPEDRNRVLNETSDRYGLPAFDPMHSELKPIVQAIVAEDRK